MKNEKLLVIGAGQMGLPLAKTASGKYDVTLVDPDAAECPANITDSAIGIFAELSDALPQIPFDIVVIATPIAQLGITLDILASRLNSDCVMTDISSAVKAEPSAIARHSFAKSGHAERIAWYIPSNPIMMS